MKRTTIIAAFPCCGKTYLANTYKENNTYFDCIDLDIAAHEDPSSCSDIINNIEQAIGKYDFVLITINDAVLTRLKEHKIPFIIAVPDNTEWSDPRRRQLVKQQWLGRFLLRGDNPAWKDSILQDYDSTTSIENLKKYSPADIVTMSECEYLSDIISRLFLQKELNDSFNATHAVYPDERNDA